MKAENNTGDFLGAICEIHFALYSSSWGRLQCNAETIYGKKYQSWTGRPEEKVTLQMLIDAIKLIDEQVLRERKGMLDILIVEVDAAECMYCLYGKIPNSAVVPFSLCAKHMDIASFILRKANIPHKLSIEQL